MRITNLNPKEDGVMLTEMLPAPPVLPNLFFSSSTNRLSFTLVNVIPKSRNPFNKVSKKAYELYLWRVKAHQVFDLLFIGEQAIMTRSEAYGYLQYLMGLSQEQAHIANFTAQQCKELIDLLDFTN